MSRGFVTVATGDDRYYRMAWNLMRSYRDNAKDTVENFAIIADRENKYTADFDDVVVLSNPSFSWMDKMRILDSCPYDENIFIDADCLVYRDITYWWDLFSDGDDFSCFGKVLPMDASDGWFTKDSVPGYDIKFITHLHGIAYYIRKTEEIESLKHLCEKIVQDYPNLRFKSFNDRIADEPVIALAMAVMNFRPVVKKPDSYCFKPYCTLLETDYTTRHVIFENPGEGHVEGSDVVHWGNVNTRKAQYRFEVGKLNASINHKLSGVRYELMYKKELKLKIYQLHDKRISKQKRVSYLLKRLPQKICERLQKNIIIHH